MPLNFYCLPDIPPVDLLDDLRLEKRIERRELFHDARSVLVVGEAFDVDEMHHLLRKDFEFEHVSVSIGVEVGKDVVHVVTPLIVPRLLLACSLRVAQRQFPGS